MREVKRLVELPLRHGTVLQLPVGERDSAGERQSPARCHSRRRNWPPPRRDACSRRACRSSRSPFRTPAPWRFPWALRRPARAGVRGTWPRSGPARPGAGSRRRRSPLPRDGGAEDGGSFPDEKLGAFVLEFADSDHRPRQIENMFARQAHLAGGIHGSSASSVEVPPSGSPGSRASCSPRIILPERILGSV